MTSGGRNGAGEHKLLVKREKGRMGEGKLSEGKNRLREDGGVDLSCLLGVDREGVVVSKNCDDRAVLRRKRNRRQRSVREGRDKSCMGRAAWVEWCLGVWLQMY